MVMTDPIADFLTRIRNANMAKHESLEVPASKIKRDIAEILKNEGFVRDVEYIDDLLHFCEISAKDLKNQNNPRSNSKEQNPTSKSAYEQSK